MRRLFLILPLLLAVALVACGGGSSTSTPTPAPGPVSSLIIVGQQAWTQNEGDTSWTTMSVADAQAEVAGLMPKDFWGSFPMDQLIGLSKDQGQEDVNGVQAHHYQISQVDAEMLAKLSEIFGGTGEADQPTSFSMDLWRVEAGGWPAKAIINVGYPPGGQVTQGQISWEVKDVNAVSGSIAPPGSTDQSSSQETPAPAPTVSGPTAQDPFASLQSYRFEMDLSADGYTSVKISGTVENPDSIRLDFYLGDSPQ
jgi:hypothetical protein